MPKFPPMKRKRGRPPTTEKAQAKFTVDTKLAKYCSKELRIVLSRCDKQLEKYRRVTTTNPTSLSGHPDLGIEVDVPPSPLNSPKELSSVVENNGQIHSTSETALADDSQDLFATHHDESVEGRNAVETTPLPVTSAFQKQESCQNFHHLSTSVPSPILTAAPNVPYKLRKNLAVATVPPQARKPLDKISALVFDVPAKEDGNLLNLLSSKLRDKNDNDLGCTPIPDERKGALGKADNSQLIADLLLKEVSILQQSVQVFESRVIYLPPTSTKSHPILRPSSPPPPSSSSSPSVQTDESNRAQDENERPLLVSYGGTGTSNAIALQSGQDAGDEAEEDSSEDEQPDQVPGGGMFCNFAALAGTAESVFNGASSASGQTMWFACIMWETKIFNDLLAHQLSGYQLYTSPLIGKLLVDSLRNEGHSWPGLSHMDWQKPFYVLDIITDDLRQCGSNLCLRVQEERTAETIGDNRSPGQWDLVIAPSCTNLAYEMVRLHSSGVKTTVILWGALKDQYTNPWGGLKGELLLRPNHQETDVLSVLIFHHETLNFYRGRMIHGPFPESELWNGFQNPELALRFLMTIDMDNKTHTRLTFHVRKDYPEMVNSVELMPTQPETISLFTDAIDSETDSDDSDDPDEKERKEVEAELEEAMKLQQQQRQQSVAKSGNVECSADIVESRSVLSENVADNEEEWEELPFDSYSPQSRAASNLAHCSTKVVDTKKNLTHYAEKMFPRPPVRAASVSLEKGSPHKMGAPRTARAQTDVGECRLVKGVSWEPPLDSTETEGDNSSQLEKQPEKSDQRKGNEEQDESGLGVTAPGTVVKQVVAASQAQFFSTQDMEKRPEEDDGDDSFHSAHDHQEEPLWESPIDPFAVPPPSSKKAPVIIKWGQGCQNGSKDQGPIAGSSDNPPPENPPTTKPAGIIWGIGDENNVPCSSRSNVPVKLPECKQVNKGGRGDTVALPTQNQQSPQKVTQSEENSEQYQFSNMMKEL